MRLIDITVNEVSLVDKAANKRKFAFMKREVVDPKVAAVKEEVKEATKILKDETVVKTIDAPKTDKLTPEQLKEVAALNAELIELVAQYKAQKK